MASPASSNFAGALVPALFPLLFLCSLAASASDSSIPESVIDDGTFELFPEILRDEAVQRINQLAQISDAEDYLERTFLSPASRRASNLIMAWMKDAGLQTWIDPMSNVHGLIEVGNSSANALLIGSHMDTVVDAGMFDGALGIICAISALKVLKISGQLKKLHRPIEVIAFSDEEGVRFQSTFLGSAAIAGNLPPAALKLSDKSGKTLQHVLKENGNEVTEKTLPLLKYSPQNVWGYVEVHIEQGPVLEYLGHSLGVVKGIAGQTRLRVTVRGSQGHAGTVPMHMRRDPMSASAELIVLLESLCKQPDNFFTYGTKCRELTRESLAGLVCTVGQISSWPSASNVIPGEVTFTVDIRAIDDNARDALIFELSKRMYQICENRNVHCTIENMHNAKAVQCDSDMNILLKKAVRSPINKLSGWTDDEIPELMSGAGHDAMAMSHLTKVGMLFVRCREGISHSPKEHVLDHDVWAASMAVLQFLKSM